MSLNRVMLIARLGKDPEVRHTTSGQTVATFSVATSERYKDKNGEWVDRIDWHNIVIWGKLAEIAGEYLAKGKEVFIEGKIQTRKYQDKDGKDRYTTEIIAEKFQMFGGKDERQDVPTDNGSDIPF